jgi:ribulose-phosphate 3-epimerase
MAIICPCILAPQPHLYREQLKRTQPFGKRIQIDLSDGVFAPVKTVDLEDVTIPKGVKADLHLMYQNPSRHMRAIVKLKPHLVIVHAEAEGDFVTFAQILHKMGMKVGVALLPETPASAIKPALEYIDHVMIFSGNLGKFGGSADFDLLIKAQAIKHLKKGLEIGWDGGVNDTNVQLLAAGGVDVLNVGGFIQKASNPAAAYATLRSKLR